MTWNAPTRLCLRAAAAAAWLLAAATGYSIPFQTRSVRIIAAIDERRWITVHEQLELFFSRTTSEFRLPLPERVSYRGQVLTYEYRAGLAAISTTKKPSATSVTEESAGGQWTMVAHPSTPMFGATSVDLSYSVRGGFLDRDPMRSTQIYWQAVPSWPSIADEVSLDLSAPQTGLVGERVISGFPEGAISTDVDIEHPTLKNPGIDLELIGGNNTQCSLLRPMAEGEGLSVVLLIPSERPSPDKRFTSSVFRSDTAFAAGAVSPLEALFSWPLFCGMPILFGVIAGLALRRRTVVRPWSRERWLEDRHSLN